MSLARDLFSEDKNNEDCRKRPKTLKVALMEKVNNHLSGSAIRKKVQVWLCWQHPIEGEFYFLLLLTLPQRGSFWQPITGSVEPEETLEAASARELREETGLGEVETPQTLDKSFQYESKGFYWEEHGYYQKLDCQGILPPKVHLSDHEHQDYRWVRARTALQMIDYESNREMFKALLKKLKI